MLQSSYPEIRFYLRNSDDYPVNYPAETFIFTNKTCYIHYEFLALLATQYPFYVLPIILNYLIQEYFYLIANIDLHNQSIEPKILQAFARFACDTSWMDLSLLAEIYQQWHEKARTLGSLTQEQLFFTERKGLLYQKLSLSLDNSSTKKSMIDAIVDSILGTNTTA